MIAFRASRPAPSLGVVLVALLVLGALWLAPGASAYSKPAGGKWNFQNLFEDTKRGALSLSRDGTKVNKLVLVPGENEAENCGAEPIRLTSKPRVQSFRKVNGRYAVANLKGSLFVGKRLTFKQGSRSFRASLELLWDESGRLVETGQFEYRNCYLSFYARKGR